MKCILCGEDTNLDSRRKNGGCCGKCGHSFAFEPQDDPLKLTDRLFAQAVQDVTSNGRACFTERQL